MINMVMINVDIDSEKFWGRWCCCFCRWWCHWRCRRRRWWRLQWWRGWPKYNLQDCGELTPTLERPISRPTQAKDKVSTSTKGTITQPFFSAKLSMKRKVSFFVIFFLWYSWKLLKKIIKIHPYYKQHDRPNIKWRRWTLRQWQCQLLSRSSSASLWESCLRLRAFPRPVFSEGRFCTHRHNHTLMTIIMIITINIIIAMISMKTSSDEGVELEGSECGSGLDLFKFRYNLDGLDLFKYNLDDQWTLIMLVGALMFV